MENRNVVSSGTIPLTNQGVELDFRYLGTEKVLRKLRPELYRPHIAKTLAEAALTGRNAARAGFDRGSPAINAVSTELRPLTARVFSAMPKKRTVSIEEGRRPNEPLLHPDALRGWMRRTGAAVSVWVIARGIRARGVKGRFFMKAAREKTALGLPLLVKKMARRIEIDFGGR